MKTFTLIKKIAKHGKQAIIVVPKILQGYLKPDTIVELKITKIEDPIFGIEKSRKNQKDFSIKVLEGS